MIRAKTLAKLRGRAESDHHSLKFILERDEALEIQKELTELRRLVNQGVATVDDLLSSTGGSILCQDYGRLNLFLVDGRKAGKAK